MSEMHTDFFNKEHEYRFSQFIEIKPWDRFFARILDYIFIITLVFYLFESLFHITPNGLVSFALYLAALFIWVPVEGFLMCIWGKTPGKWLLSIKVTNQDDKKPNLKQAMTRSFRTWLYGIGMGIPVISVICLVNSYKTLVNSKGLPFDKENGLYVYHGYHGTYKMAVVVIVYTMVILQIISMLPLGQTYTPVSDEPEYAEEAEYLNELGYSLMEEGKYLQAREMFLKGLETCSGTELRDTLLNNLSWACYNLGEYEKALIYSQEGLELGDNSSNEYTNYGNALYALGYISEAENAYRTAVDIDKNNQYALYDLGMINYNSYCYYEAISIFENYTSIEKADPDGWCYLGLSYLYGSSNTVKAKECLDRAFRLSPDHLFVINSLCEYYSYIGDYKEAEDLYLKAFEKIRAIMT